MQVATSVIGRNCRVGKNVRIHGSHLHNNVTVEDGATVQEALLCEGCVVMADAVIKPGAILSFKVSRPTLDSTQAACARCRLVGM